MIRMRLTVLLPTLCLILTVPAWAQQDTQPAQPMQPSQPMPTPQPQQQPMPMTAPDQSGVPSFDQLDANHDGKLTRSEIPKHVDPLKQLRAHFQEADKDGNGTLSPDEYMSYTTPTTGGP